MSVNLNVNRLSPSIEFPTPNFTNIEEIQQQVIHELEAEAQDLPVDRRSQFLAGVRQHAGDILKFLDLMEKHGAFPFKIMGTARVLYAELKEIGEEFVHATDQNHRQFSREMSTYESFRNFQVNLPELNLAQDHPVPSFEDLMESSRHANAEMNIRGNMLLAKMTAGLIRAGGTVVMEAARVAVCDLTPANSLMCKAAVKLEEAAGHPVKKTVAEVTEIVESFLPKNQALAHELNSQFGIPLEKGKKYGENAFLVGTTLLPVPPGVKFVERLIPRAAVRSAAGRSGMSVGTLHQSPGGFEKARIFYEETSEGIVTFNVNSVKIGDVEVGTSLSALKEIREMALPLKPKEVRVQWENAKGRDLLTVQSWLEPVGHKPLLSRTTELVPTFKLATRFLKDDFGGVVIPFHAGVKPSITERSGECFRKLTLNVKNIQSSHYAKAPNRPFLHFLHEFRQSLLPYIHDLSPAVFKLADPDLARAPLRAMVREVTGIDPLNLSLAYLEGGRKIYYATNVRNALYITEAGFENVVGDFVALHHMRAMNFKHLDVPLPLIVAKYGDRFFIITSDVGDSIGSLMHKMNQHPLGSKNRMEEVAQLTKKFYEAGVALGEVHAKDASIVMPKSQLHKDYVLRVQSNAVEALEKRGLSNHELMKIFQSIDDTLSEHPITTGLEHGDMHVGNLKWNEKTGRVGLVDFLMHTNYMNAKMKPLGFPIFDYVDFLSSIREASKLLGLPEEEFVSITKAVKEGYRTKHLGEHPSIEEQFSLMNALDIYEF